jgi:hypothetical protein
MTEVRSNAQDLTLNLSSIRCKDGAFWRDHEQP